MRIKFSENLKALMTLHGISQDELARRLDITDPQVFKYLSGDDFPTLPRLIQIADVFEVTIDFLVGRSTTKLPNSDTTDKTTGA